MKPKILIIEDEISISELVKYNLEKNNYSVDVCVMESLQLIKFLAMLNMT